MNKPPPPKLPAWRQWQKAALDGVAKAADVAGKAAAGTAQRLREVDREHGISKRARELGHTVKDKALEVDARYDLASKASRAGRQVASGLERSASSLKQAADQHGVSSALKDHLIDPARRLARAVDAVDANEAVGVARGVAEEAYGASRRVVKEVVAPDLPTHDARDLLEVTRRELDYLAACILQISPDESSRLGEQFGRAVTAKVAGAASTTALLAAVAAFGHAGTGAAISGLSGAAATSATMAWVGSLVGGGVAAGTALTGGVALVVGLAAYRLLHSESRSFETLSPLEQRIVQSCWMLGAVADAYRQKPNEFSPEAAESLLTNALLPLYREVESKIETLCAPLDGKHAIALRQHVLRDFKVAVLDRFEIYLAWARSDEGRAWHEQLRTQARQRKDAPSEADILRVMREGSAEAAIGGVLAALLTRSALDDSPESRLVLDALRRSATSLENATEAQLSDYLNRLDPEALRGVASNVKGIYHELWFVEQYNATHSDTFARVFEATNHPGADVQICSADTGAVLDEIQLKAVDGVHAIREHLQRYPDIDVAATGEVAAQFDDERVSASGFSNHALHEDSRERLDALRDHDHDVLGRAGDTAEIALAIASTAELVQMLRGEREFPEAIMNTAAKVGTAAGATALTAFLFG